jgi:hypothetical protein
MFDLENKFELHRQTTDTQHCNFILKHCVFASNPVKFFPWSLWTNKDKKKNNRKNNGFLHSLHFVSSKINARLYLKKNKF